MFGSLRFSSQRGCRFKTNHKQNGNRRLEEQVVETLWCQHFQCVCMHIVELWVIQTEHDCSNRESEESKDLEHIDDDVR